MKIAIFSSNDFIEGTGSNSRLKAYARGLVEEGDEVTFFFTHASSFNDSGLNTKAKGIWKGIPYLFFSGKCYRPQSIAGKMVDSFSSMINATYYLLRHGHKFDVFLIYSPSILFYWHIILLLKWIGKPVVIEWTELHSSYGTRMTLKDRFVRAMHRQDEKHAHNIADHIIVISRNLKQHYLRFFPPERITLLPIVVDLNRFEGVDCHRPHSHIIGYLGSFGHKDGVTGILNAFGMALEENPHLRLRLMGWCPEREKVVQAIKEMQLESKVEFLGQLTSDEIPCYLQQCDVLIVNRPDTRYSNFGFPTKLGEYLASGRPTIVTRVGDVEQYLTHGYDTWMIPPDDDRQLAGAILQRFAEYDRFEEIGKRGRETCQKLFSHTLHIKRLKQIFEQLVKN
ncbi:MAG: glycosyltransferase family 4 protein [Bacteroidia bacterium]